MDLNKVMLIWRITSDVDVKKMDSWSSVINFTVATNRKYKNKEENVVEESEFHRCVAFWSQADLLGKYLEKWKKVYVEWRLRTRKWEDNQWQPRYTTELIVENFIFLDSKWAPTPTDKAQESHSWDEELPF